MLKKVLLLIVFSCISVFAQYTVSTAAEPIFSKPFVFGASAACGVNVTENNAVTVRYGTNRTLLGGLYRDFIEFFPDAILMGDLQAGETRINTVRGPRE